MKTCPVCSVSYWEELCPNQWRLYKAPFRKTALLEFTEERHREAGVAVRRHREAQAALATTTEVKFIGGKSDGRRVKLTATPPRVIVAEESYEAVVDPDNGEFLGAYYKEDRE